MSTTTPAAPLDLPAAAHLPCHDVLVRLGSDREGLSASEAATRLRTVGPNVLHTHQVTAIGVFIRQVRNPLLILLLAAAAVSGVTGDPTDAVIIGLIVLLSVGLGFVNEYRSEQAVAALHGSIRHEALVRRGNVDTKVDVRDLVPGDVVTMGIGNIVPADLRLLSVSGLECDEAVLTGESLPGVKNADPAPRSDSPVDLPSCAFMGTVVHHGSGEGVVVATGSRTTFGAIAAGLETPPAYTAFQAGLAEFSRFLVWIAGALTVSIFVINIALARPIIDALLFSLAIAIGISPQLLPAIVSVSLASGSRELARRKVLVKRLVTIEDLGNIQVLFTDKTGTLTQGAVGFDAALDAAGAMALQPFLLGLLCNQATRTEAGIVGGNPLDVALLEATASHELPIPPNAYTRQATLPFDHERQMASVVVRRDGEAPMLVTKGAPEAVFARCVDLPAQAQDVLNGLFAAGDRVVAVASRPASGATLGPEDERDLTLAGFLTFMDPVKADAAPSIARLHDLGIAVKVITGDNGAVAVKVCGELGLDPGTPLSGSEIATMDDAALAGAIAGTTIFARVSPAQKSRIVALARKNGDDVAFMGDGVNDAVALHSADVGISVDSATDVAKDAADIVLLDKDLGVVADGVMEGRRIFANTMKYIQMATSSNFGNMFSAAGASIFLSFLPMLPSQILLNNILYDTGQLAIPGDEVDAEALARPAAWDIGFIRRFMALFGPLSSIFDFLTFFVMLQVLHAGHAEFRTGWFVESLATQTLVVFVIRTRRVPFFRSRPSRAMALTPTSMALIGAILPFTPLAHLLGFTALPLSFFLILFGMILAYLVLVESVKGWFYARERTRAVQAQRPPEQKHAHRVHRRAHRFFGHRLSFVR